MSRGIWHWTKAIPNGPASDPVELVMPDGTLAGVQLRTLQTAWGQYNDKRRAEVQQHLLNLLNADVMP